MPREDGPAQAPALATGGPVKTRIVLALAATAAAAAADAQNLPVFDLERLMLDPAARGSLVVGNGEIGPEGTVRLSLTVHYEREPLVLLRSGDERGYGVEQSVRRQGDIVRERLTLHAGVAAAVLDRLELHLVVPWIPWQGRDDLTAAGVATPKDYGVGTPSAGVKWGFLRQDRGTPVSAAIAADVLLNWGTQEAVAGNETVAFTPRLELGRRFGSILLAAQGGGLVRTKRVTIPQVGGVGKDLHSEILGGLAIATAEGPLRLEASGRGAWNFDGVGQSYEVLAGGRYLLGVGEIFLLGGPGFNVAPGTPLFRVLFGLALNFEPEKPAPAPPPPPPPPPDPCAPGQRHAPEQCPNLDDDGDGIPNGQDECPLEKGIPELKGCPPKDSDGDGIPDHLDKCPNEPGTAEYQGCPPPAKAELKTQGGVTKIEIKERVYFDTGKATIQERSHALLDDVAQVLRSHPEVAKVVVEGHTDNTGARAFNQKLSQDRALAVRAYLVGKGIEPERLEAKGYGQTRPVADNKTAAGREQNRRVEFVVP